MELQKPLIPALNQRITIQEPTEAKDAQHEPIKTYSNIATRPHVWAEIRELGGRELFEAQQLRAENTVKIKIYARSDLNTKMRIVYGGTTLQINYIPIYTEQQFMTLRAHIVQ